ncbi:MAG: winged helix-turn-helix transcriptional regulator [Rhodospirillaceae bacterium]|jgi:DNA-binding MarR family transcriptional regulator|nr:winged helix-turn-helix transcriptional regulator [Rhodospirillaceae bacterium]MBT5945557.1 winged helix-turn-helix transcriptional regulator [Rhodospirillaceae bacterium]MBT6404434.1 winged helix-turn-helix transcriptional regulator [Rhodospirillaceae bacterium]MBT6536415.1 winged helix-turn-helix transcriptional regulator [Rhodospirillaceae bacterium]MBT7362223.1 winged helix-turn-helix transcriptional regulator [Rhodospirillaceae bacterium]
MPDTAHGSARTHLALETFLPYRLSILSNTVSNAIARDYHEQFGLTVPEWRVMAVLGRFGPDAATGICSRTAMDKVTVSRAMTRLMDRDLITRNSDSADRRRVIARLTRKGRSIHDKIIPVALAHEEQLVAALSPAEAKTFGRLLTKLQDKADALTAP